MCEDNDKQTDEKQSGGPLQELEIELKKDDRKLYYRN